MIELPTATTNRLLIPCWARPCLFGVLSRARLVRLLVITDDAFQGTDRKCRTFLAAGYQGDRAQSHLTSLLYLAVHLRAARARTRPWTPAMKSVILRSIAGVCIIRSS